MTTEDLIFEKHYEYYKNIGIETIKQQAGQVEQVSSDYQGRVIYELLQNAFDKAEKRILVMVRGNSLYVANDGDKFTYVADYDYGRGSSKRGDFQSMCSISTSTKSADTSIGNKGVGFKSVFSISESGFVNVCTHGVIHQDDKIIPEIISFRIYDSFKDPENIPEDFSEDLKLTIKQKLNLVQHERKDRGIPGYYFPFHITSEASDICELFDDGYVSVIQIPFKDKAVIKELFDDIKNIHFQFIQLKKDKEFEIEFCFDGEPLLKLVKKESPNLFSTIIDSEILKDLAVDAEISIKKPKVAFFIREDENGYLYNYLPTKVQSPFKYVDFHADFHTTVDRKSINFDGKIGKYNKALLKACVELYFSVINNYLDVDSRIELKTEFIDRTIIKYSFDNFIWRLFILQANSPELFNIVRSILQIWHWHNYVATDYLSQLARKYFLQKRERGEHTEFLISTLTFINRFATDSQKYEGWLDKFKSELARKLLEYNAQIIPDAIIAKNSEILFRKTSENNIRLPEFLGVNISDFEILDNSFKKALGINDFNDYNVLLKYYKQCSFAGEYNEDSFTEDQQIELIKSLFRIYEAKKEQSFLTTHRFTKAYNSKLRENNSSLNQAYFNVSTVFLKTKQHKYKPSQLCNLKELDLDFLNAIVNGDKINDFLRFLGVSTHNSFLFADCRLFEKLKDGIEYIPALVNRGDEKIDEELIRNFKIITPKGVSVHPSIVNDNNYRFLENISNQTIKAELENLLVNRYNEFPGPYRENLKARMDKNLSHKNDVIRLYQNVFHLFEKSKQKQYLVIANGQLFWTESLNFNILNNKRDFELVSSLNSTRILCYYTGIDVPEYLKDKMATLKKGKINFDMIQHQKENLKERIEQRIVYLLISISHSKNSVKNYLDDNIDLGEIPKRLDRLEIIEVNQLQQEIIFNEISIPTQKDFAIDESDPGKIYFKSGASNIDKAQCIAEYLFNNSSIKELVELIVFYKENDDLKRSVENVDFEIINKKWKVDYAQKFVQFENEILSHFGNILIDEKWYIYNDKHRSTILIDLDNSGKLNELYQVVNSLKMKDEYQGYFDNFEIEIDRNEIEILAAKLISFLKIKDGMDELIQQIYKLSIQLGVENKLKKIENEIEIEYDEYKGFKSGKESLIAKEIRFDSKINEIFGKIGNNNSKKINSVTCNGNTVSAISIPINSKKIIFQQNGFGNNNVENLEIIGASGEEEVLIYFIHEFIKLSTEERRIGIDAVYKEVKAKTGNDLLLKYKDKCITVIDNDEDLKKALIPLFYITMHYKFSYFDIIAYQNKRSIIVEVKTTNGINNNRFFLSIAEVNAARTFENYEIVRVSPDSLRFLGNPIKSLEGKIELLKAETFSLTPRNYEFNFISK